MMRYAMIMVWALVLPALSLGQSVPVRVSFENLAPAMGTHQTPIWVGFHDGSFDFFDAGAPASASLEALAEDGNTSLISQDFLASGAGLSDATLPGPMGPLAPGEMSTQVFMLDPMDPKNRFFSFASMVLPSNDAFVGNDDPHARAVFDSNGDFVGGSFIVGGQMVRDAGTEVNDELPANTAFLAQSMPNTGMTEGGVVSMHPGFLPAGSGNILSNPSFVNANFLSPGYMMFRVRIERADMIPVRVRVKNMAPSLGTYQTPVWVGFHDGSFDLFDTGAAASPALERLAEDGNTAPVAQSFVMSSAGIHEGTIPFHGAAGPGPLAPGQESTLIVMLDPTDPKNRYFSFASMVIPSNDAFIANDNPMAHPVFNPAGEFLGGSFVVAGSHVLDAGSEVNDELPMNTAFFGQAAPNTGVSENGVVATHMGFMAPTPTNILGSAGFANADFKAMGYHTLRITIERADRIPLRISVQNLAPQNGSFQTPVWVGLHDGSFDLFNVGSSAAAILGNAALERLAEDGSTAPLSQTFQNSGAGQHDLSVVGPAGPFAPGDEASEIIWVDPLDPHNRYLSFASMVIPSNDAFIANPNPLAHPIFDPSGQFNELDVIVNGSQVLDAGTEVNDELPAHTAFLGQMTPNTGVMQNGVVAPHFGFNAPAAGNILGTPQFAAADFLAPGYQCLRIRVQAVPMVSLTQSGGPGSPVMVIDRNLMPGREYFNVFSLEPCPGGPGSGPASTLGLCTTNLNGLIEQVLLPLGTTPFHFLAGNSTQVFGPFTLPPLTVEAVCFHFGEGQVGPVSSVTRLVIH